MFQIGMKTLNYKGLLLHVERLDRAFAQDVKTGSEARAVRQPARAAPRITRTRMAAMVSSGASTVGLLAGQPARARAHARSGGKG